MIRHAWAACQATVVVGHHGRYLPPLTAQALKWPAQANADNPARDAATDALCVVSWDRPAGPLRVIEVDKGGYNDGLHKGLCKPGNNLAAEAY